MSDGIATLQDFIKIRAYARKIGCEDLHYVLSSLQLERELYSQELFIDRIRMFEDCIRSLINLGEYQEVMDQETFEYWSEKLSEHGVSVECANIYLGTRLNDIPILTERRKDWPHHVDFILRFMQKHRAHSIQKTNHGGIITYWNLPKCHTIAMEIKSSHGEPKNDIEMGISNTSYRGKGIFYMKNTPSFVWNNESEEFELENKIMEFAESPSDIRWSAFQSDIKGFFPKEIYSKFKFFDKSQKEIQCFV